MWTATPVVQLSSFAVTFLVGTRQILVSMGDFARGLELLKRSAVLDPECPLPYANAARAYLGMNDLVAARRQVGLCALLP